MKSDDLLTRILNDDSKNPPLLDRHRLAIIALRDSIKHALNAGASQKRVWTQLQKENKILCSYSTFSRHVKLLILCENKQETHTKEESKSVKKQTKNSDEQQQVTPKEKKEDAITNFVFKQIHLTKDDL